MESPESVHTAIEAGSGSKLSPAVSNFWLDAVLMLAVLHHLLVTERIPLEAVLEAAAEITRDYLLVEFVAPEDPMFIRIARGREHLHAGLNLQVFENACRNHFDILRSTRVGEGHRWLYWLRKRERLS